MYLRNAGKARICLQFDDYSEPTRLSISGYLNIGKNQQHVDVYERGADGTGWNRASVPSITVSLSRGPEAIAKDIVRRCLPEYLRILALAEDKLAKDAEYENKIAANLQRLAEAAGVKITRESNDGRGEIRKAFHFRVGESRYYDVAAASADDCSLNLPTLSFAQAERIIHYLKGGEVTLTNLFYRCMFGKRRGEATGFPAAMRILSRVRVQSAMLQR